MLSCGDVLGTKDYTVCLLHLAREGNEILNWGLSGASVSPFRRMIADLGRGSF
jgi:hypothetical protein